VVTPDLDARVDVQRSIRLTTLDRMFDPPVLAYSELSGWATDNGLVTGESQVIEEAPCKKLGFDLMERLWASYQMTEGEATRLASRRNRKYGESPKAEGRLRPNPGQIWLEGLRMTPGKAQAQSSPIAAGCFRLSGWLNGRRSAGLAG
jgi:hypothetical protein